MAKRTGAMTERQRVEALLNHQKPDRVPIWHEFASGFATLYGGGSLANAYNNPQVAYAAERKTAQDYGWVFWPIMAMVTGAWEFGGEIKWPSGEFAQSPRVVRRPVETLDDAMNLKMPDVKNAGMVPILMEFSKLSSQEKLDNEPFNVTCWVCGPFTFAAELPGLATFAKWLIKEPEAVHHMMRLATDYFLEVVQYWKDTFGTDGVLVYSAEPTAANHVISAKQFEQFAFPYLKESHEKILAMGYKHIFHHICGEQNDNLPYWAKVPFGAPGLLSFGHEVDLEKAAEYFPNDIIFGNLEPTIIQTGTPEEVYQAARKVIEKGKSLPTGYIFSLGCETPPRAPWGNMMAITKAINDFGWYE